MANGTRFVYRLSPYKFDLQKDSDGLNIGYSLNEITINKYLQVYNIETNLLVSETLQGSVYTISGAVFEKLRKQYTQDFINGDTSLALSEQQGLKTKLDTLSSQSIDDISTSMKAIKEYQKNKDENMFGKDGYYTKKNALGQDKTDREIDGHKQEYDPVAGHKAKLDSSLYYPKHTAQFSQASVANAVDAEMHGIMNELEHSPNAYIDIPTLTSDGTEDARAYIDMVNIYRVTRGLEPFPVVEVTGKELIPDLKIDLGVLQKMRELKAEGKTASEIIAAITTGT